MVEDDVAVQDLLICCKAYGKLWHKIRQCRTVASKCIFL